MRTNAPQWASTLLQKNAQLPLQILSGQSSKLVAGDIMRSVVQKGEQPGSFRVLLNGEPFDLKGLPISAAGRELSFMVQKGAGGKLELVWLNNPKQGATKHGQPQQQGQNISKQSSPEANHLMQQRRSGGMQTTLLSLLPAAVKTGKPLAARIDSIQANKMSMTLILSDSKQSSQTVAQGSLPNTAVITTPTMGLKVGQKVTLHISPNSTSGKTTVEIRPQIEGSMANSISRSEAQSPQLGKINMATGDTALAIVQKRLGNGNIQINLKGVQLEVAAPPQIKSGDALEIKLTKAPADFQVIQLHKNISQKALTLLRQNLPNSGTPVAHNLNSIRNMIPNISSSDLSTLKGLPQLEAMLIKTESSRDYPINGERLAQVIRDSGSSLEAKLQAVISRGEQPQALQQDLKAILLQIAGDQGSGKVQNSELIRLITELSQQSSSRIETGQALNILANLQGEALRIEFPMLVGQQLINVQMAVQQQNQFNNHHSASESSDQSFNVLFALELSELGKMKVDANISDNSVHARIYNESSSARDFLQQHIGQLEERLQSLGYEKVYLITSANAPDTEKQQRFDELATMRPASFSLLDLLV